ncbi:MAG: hypothetical protein ABSG60_07545 [Terracidiphilus sp.]|jgi:hypothetical protein
MAEELFSLSDIRAAAAREVGAKAVIVMPSNARPSSAPPRSPWAQKWWT